MYDQCFILSLLFQPASHVGSVPRLTLGDREWLWYLSLVKFSRGYQRQQTSKWGPSYLTTSYHTNWAECDPRYRSSTRRSQRMTSCSGRSLVSEAPVLIVAYG